MWFFSSCGGKPSCPSPSGAHWALLKWKTEVGARRACAAQPGREGPRPYLLPHVKLPSQGFVPAIPSAIITSPAGITVHRSHG